jgi:hypothetical protein
LCRNPLEAILERPKVFPGHQPDYDSSPGPALRVTEAAVLKPLSESISRLIENYTRWGMKLLFQNHNILAQRLFRSENLVPSLAVNA